jgi:hypothetical protein
MYRRGNHFGEDVNKTDDTFQLSTSFYGKACPKLIALRVTPLSGLWIPAKLAFFPTFSHRADMHK